MPRDVSIETCYLATNDITSLTSISLFHFFHCLSSFCSRQRKSVLAKKVAGLARQKLADKYGVDLDQYAVITQKKIPCGSRPSVWSAAFKCKWCKKTFSNSAGLTKTDQVSVASWNISKVPNIA